MRVLWTIGILILSLTSGEAQYISRVFEFVPAPGQFTNAHPWGTPSAASSLEGGVNGSLCLGGFGGYVVFAFEEPVENDPANPFGIDFTLFGNPMENWSEPGVVWVMKDENQNGLPDDTWFELAGSDHLFTSTRKNYRVSYSNPGDTVAMEVPWTDHLGARGSIQINASHTQSYYPLQDSFPAIDPTAYTLKGTLIAGAIDVDHPPVLKSVRRSFGYADNQMRGQSSINLPDNPYTPEVENSGGDAFDIHWATDSTGSYVDLDRIHFIKVQNAMLADGKWLGELSTEITGAVDVAPDPSVEGSLDLLVIKDLPLEMAVGEHLLEAFAFYQGRVVSDAELEWSSTHPQIFVDKQNVLRANEPGGVTLTASLKDKPDVKAKVSTEIVAEATSSQKDPYEAGKPRLFPNPASDYFQIRGIGNGAMEVFTAEGRCVFQTEDYRGDPVKVRAFSSGIYVVRVHRNNTWQYFKLLIR